MKIVTPTSRLEKAKARRAYLNKVRRALGLPAITKPVTLKRGRRHTAASKRLIAKGVKMANKLRKALGIKVGDVRKTKLYKQFKK